MKIEKISIDKLTPYKNNAKLHDAEQVEQIKKSIQEFGNNDPIAVWGKDNTIVEGHGRWLALQELGYKEVDIIRLDHLTDEQRRAYTLVHNKLTMNSGFDLDMLEEELENIDIDMEDFGFKFDELDEDTEEEEENPYTTKINIPQYEIKGENPELDELVDKTKTEELIKEIRKSNVSDSQKNFLIMAAQRHLGFNYSKVAEYYAHQDKEMQDLMEKSALVIIDYDDAIKNGYAQLKSEIDKMADEEVDYED